MNSSIDEFLNHVDEWKIRLHRKLKRMTPLQQKAFWKEIQDEARARGLRIVQLKEAGKRPTKRTRRTG